MSSVTYRKVGSKWHIRFRSPGKKEITKSLPGNLYEKTVAAKAGWYEQEMSLGRFDPWTDSDNSDSSELLRTVINRYIEFNHQSGNWTPATKQTNHSRLYNGLEPFLRKPIKTITQSKIQQHLNDYDVSAVTKKGYRSSWNAFFRYCHEKGYLNDRILVSLSIDDKITIRNQKTIKYLTWQQVNHICKAVHFHHQQIYGMYDYSRGKGADYYCELFWFMFYTLLRKEEVPDLKVKDLLPGGKLRVHGKGRSVDIIPLPPPALEIAEKHAKDKQPEDPLLCEHMNRPTVQFKRAVRMALGDDHSTGFHQLRHGGVAHYFTLGKPVQFVSKLARHKNVQTTLEVYGDVIPDGLSSAFSDISHGPAT